jgi:hypothetical protein
MSEGTNSLPGTPMLSKARVLRTHIRQPRRRRSGAECLSRTAARRWHTCLK